MLPLRLDSLDALAAIVRRGGFRAAAAERGVSSSALSQTITGLEQTLGIRLLHRTTRSVAPTEAGARLLERLNPALDDIRGALEDLDRLRDAVLTEQERRARIASLPEQIATMRQEYLDAGGDPAALDADN